MSTEHDPYAALRLPDYRRLLGCSVLASMASEIQAVVVGWELYQRTDSSMALGYVGLIQFLPVLLLSLPAGHVADRYSRKTILTCTLLLTALASIGLALLSWSAGPILLIYACIAVVGIAQAFSAPARWSLLPSVVPAEALHNAVTWNSSGWQIASTLGPALGGVGVWLAGDFSAVYLGAAGCSLAALALFWPVRVQSNSLEKNDLTIASLLAGLRFVWSNELILATITLDLFAVLFGGATALLPVFARDLLEVGPAWYGWLRAAPSIGAFGMALALAYRPPLQRAGPTLLWAVAGFGVATIVFSISRDPLLSFAMLALTGAFDNVSVVVRSTLVQVLTPDAMRGRVSAVNAVFIGSSNELGAYESGLTSAYFGPVASVLGGGIASLAVVGLVMLRWPAVMRLGALHMANVEDYVGGGNGEK